MSIVENIRIDLKQAMRDKNQLRLEVLRGLISGFTNELVANKMTPQDPVTDDMAMKVLQRSAKQRQDALEQFTQGGRADLAEKEKAELEIIKTYLPEMMSEEDIKKIVEAKKNELGINDKSQMGMFMGKIMGELKGKADGNVVKKIVEELF